MGRLALPIGLDGALGRKGTLRCTRDCRGTTFTGPLFNYLLLDLELRRPLDRRRPRMASAIAAFSPWSSGSLFWLEFNMLHLRLILVHMLNDICKFLNSSSELLQLMINHDHLPQGVHGL